MSNPINLDTLNEMDQTRFIKCIGDIFEHSPWVAERAWQQRPFSSLEALHTAMVNAMKQAAHNLQLALIRAHPELAGKLAEQGLLTADSTAEQASAGLNQCSAEELREIRELNQAHQEKFGFPFILAVKGRNKAEILQAFRLRLECSPEQAFAESLEQIARIARLRLTDRFQD